MHDVIIIGAGPAGLQAALTLGRMHRRALVIDSGEYRNGTVRHMHNVIANDGTSPADFRAVARAQLGEYATIEFRSGSVLTVAAVERGFQAALDDGTTVRGATLLLATGMADDLPPVPGLDGLWGRRAFSCPFCDGHEFAGKRIGLLGANPRAEHLVRLLGPIAGEIVVFDDGALTDEERQALAALGATVHSAPVTAVAEHGEGVSVQAGTAVEVAGLFVAAGGVRQRAPFAAQLELAMLPSGAIAVDDFGRTSMPGVWAAGDLAHRAGLPGVMASVMVAAAAGQTAAAAIVNELAG